jgi:hypothetical protein
MPTGPRKKTYLPCQLLISYTGLLVEIRVWDQAYPYRHVAVRKISLGERDYEPVLIWPRQVSPTGILSKDPCHGKLSP